MRILLIGDSITDMSRNRQSLDFHPFSYGSSYAFFVEGELATKFPGEYQVLNRGISGNRVVDLYARMKADIWNLKPDVISILIGVNDVSHGLEEGVGNGVDIERYEKVYRMLIEDTKKVLPGVKFILLEPFVLDGTAEFDRTPVPEYARAVKRISDSYNTVFVPLQERFSMLAEKHGAPHYLYDGVHPSVAGSKIISEEWLSAFYKMK